MFRKTSKVPVAVVDDTPSASKANGTDGTAEENPLAADNMKTTSEQMNDNGGNDDREGGNADDSERTTGSVRADASELNLKSIEEEYLDKRETARVMMHLISTNDHKNLTEWISRLDQMTSEEGQLERLLYIKYLVMTLGEMYGLVEPFTSPPTEIMKSLRTILPPLVYADLVEERPEKCFRTVTTSKASLGSDGQTNEPKQPVQDDRLFYTQQLFPPEGILCYAAAFSSV